LGNATDPGHLHTSIGSDSTQWPKITSSAFAGIVVQGGSSAASVLDVNGLYIHNINSNGSKALEFKAYSTVTNFDNVKIAGNSTYIGITTATSQIKFTSCDGL